MLPPLPAPAPPPCLSELVRRVESGPDARRRGRTVREAEIPRPALAGGESADLIFSLVEKTRLGAPGVSGEPCDN